MGWKTSFYKGLIFINLSLCGIEGVENGSFSKKQMPMCGRFSFAVSESKIQQELPFVDPGINIRKSYNIAPTQHAYVVINEQPDRLQYITWGLIPYWSEEGKNTGKLINARAEGIESKPSFRVPIRKRRCLVLADSFYEWRTVNHQKIPYRVVPKDGSMLVMAGVWDVWEKDGYPLKSFSIITTEPNKEVSSLHNRMPVVLPTIKECKQWLEPMEVDEVLQFLHTPQDGFFRIYRVSDELNSPKYNLPELHNEIPENLDLFSQR